MISSEAITQQEPIEYDKHVLLSLKKSPAELIQLNKAVAQMLEAVEQQFYFHGYIQAGIFLSEVSRLTETIIEKIGEDYECSNNGNS